MKFYIYVIQSEEGLRYTGITVDLGTHSQEHNNKSLSFWTKRGNNWRIIYFEDFISKRDALKRENG